ncbi:MAG: UDP-3-O-(3-hydroxymyristoyl)glucosamine N-acyltransferase [Flavobacteriales bacterium]|jgi:UDP-3-O-[3-hydroxymyristoyl] glucosamine N-acyltransferase|nr:UDP-3-O-(3-hydroxymyristoyl)glucosamine N-acyltransferase [Flavobacteriales bacterium]
MKFTATQISEILEGEIDGDPNIEVFKLSKIEEGVAGSLTFLSNPKYAPFLYNTDASVVIVNNTFIPEKAFKTTLIKVEDSYEAFSKLLSFYNETKLNKIGISKLSFISDSALVGENTYIAEFAFVGENVKLGNNVKLFPNVYIGDNVEIGDNTVLFSGVKIYSESIIGAHCAFHSGVIIGSDGFGFAPSKNGVFSKIPQIGNVIIEDHVDIGANTTIDRATLGSTIIRKGVKLDNQIQIAHNVEIDENTVIAAQTGVAGSVKIGKNCKIGGQVGIAGHLVIGDFVNIQAQTGVGRNLSNNETVQGSPALPYSDYYKSYVHFKNLSKLVDKVSSLEKELLKLKKD